MTDDPNNDFLAAPVQAYFRELMQLRLVTFLHFGIPCNTWSRARRHDGRGPGPVRDDTTGLYGLEDLTEKDAGKVRDANRILRLVLSLCKLAIELGIPFTIENPATSRLWLTREIKCLERRGCMISKCSFCQYGMPWRKNTKFLHYGVGGLQNHLQICHSFRGICTLTGKPHTTLQGSFKGTFLTRLAQPYPTKLCRVLASVVAKAVPSHK